MKPLLVNLFLRTLLGNLFPGTLPGNPCLRTYSWKPFLQPFLGNLFLGTLIGNLFLGTLLGTFLGTLPGDLFLGTWVGNRSWQPCLRTCSWEICLEILFFGWLKTPSLRCWGKTFPSKFPGRGFQAGIQEEVSKQG